MKKPGRLKLWVLFPAEDAPGKRGVQRAKMMVDKGAEAIVIASCISRGNPIGYPCPNFSQIKESIIRTIGASIKIIDWTH